jgi:hypothetical protein
LKQVPEPDLAGSCFGNIPGKFQKPKIKRSKDGFQVFMLKKINNRPASSGDLSKPINGKKGGFNTFLNEYRGLLKIPRSKLRGIFDRRE